SLSTKQRLAKAKKLSLPQIVQPQDKHESSHHKFLAAEPEQSSFQPCPPEVVFQNYSPGEVYEVPVVLRNRDKVPHFVKVTLESSPYFQLVGPNDVCCKVPPGLYAIVRILFTPGQNKDYFHKLLCTTEREEFIVPIRAIGPRAILDFPDQLDFSTRAEPFLSRKAMGEETHTSLHGRAVDVPIRLDRNTVSLEKTYIGMSNRTTVRIHNQSNITARFQWKAVDTEEEEHQLELRQYPRIFRQQKEKLYDFLKERGVDITCREHLALLTHSFQSEVAKIREDGILFHDDVFSLEPKKGRFLMYFHFAFLLLLQAVLFNNGPIEAPFKLIPPSTAMGSCFTFQPQEGIVAPSTLQAISVSFCPTILGQFEEEFCFDVSESPEPVTFTIRGYVMGPTFHFDVSALDFGDVSFGFPRTLNCCLFNTSLTPMVFHLYIPGDGLGEPSIDSSTQMCKCSSQSWRKEAQGLRRPREFDIRPCRGTVRALGSQDIKVTLCSNTVGEYKLQLVLDVDDVGEKVLALPLTASIGLEHSEQPAESWGLVHFSSAVGKRLQAGVGRAKDLTTRTVVLDVADTKIRHKHKLKAANLPHLDSEEPALLLTRAGFTSKIQLECIGRGPVVYVHPREINFGSIPVLEDCFQTLHLANQCDLPAVFWVEMAGKCSCWRIEPSKGVISPKSEMSVAVIANLNDTVKFREKVKVFIENSYTTIISLQAVGIGTTIVTDKPLIPKLDLKSHFSFTPCYFHFKVTNRGRRMHRLYWNTEGFRMRWRRDRAPALGGTKSKGASPMPRPGSPVFRLWPPQVDLRPGQSADMVLEGCSSTAQEVKERLLCHALVGKEITKKQIMQVDVTCNFICPVLQMSSRAITFCVVKEPSDVLMQHYKPFSLKNTSPLPVSIVLDLEQPFLICNVDWQPLPADSKPITLDVGEELHLRIQFNPAYENNLHSWVAKRVLRVRFMEHPREEKITVRGEVHFPNLHLQAKAVDFGCIINDTEQVLHMEMTNCSPLPVEYRWSFLVDSPVNTIRFISPPPKFKPQSSKKKGVFPRRYSKTESVDEPTETPETMQDSAQEDSAQEDSYEEDPAHKDPAHEDPAQEDSAQQDFAGASLSHCRSTTIVMFFSRFISPPPKFKPQSSKKKGVFPRRYSKTESVDEPTETPETMQGSAPEDPAQEDSAQEDSDQEPADAEDSLETKVFDILPLWGMLQPGESQKVTFTFFGHANIMARATALCRVEGGPTYEVVLSGQASCPSYRLDVEEIDWGLQVFNKVLKAGITLRNNGVMKFTYVVQDSSRKPLPGVPVVVPRKL
ncbi:hydrocephalus-inducing protein-like, partial [Passer montanus]|uniref:hydrocephalus-inducing protein-like n=1 Tax=Passer montanus TaxID=9160 RepID=UPI00196099A5